MPISPNQGSISGGTTVTITGINLVGALSVHFGDQLATITANTPTSITVVNPPGNGVVDVTVTTNGGTSNFLFFYYIPSPIVTSLNPNTGPVAGGNTITILGFNLSTASSISFGSNTATPTIISDSEIQVTVPAGSAAGSIPVVITTVGGIAAGISYTYVDTPTITNLTPTSGATVGGTSVTITGTNLSTTTSVTIGGTNSSFGVVDSTTLVVITPPGTVGAADVVITTTGGSATAVGGYTYVNGPGI